MKLILLFTFLCINLSSASEKEAKKSSAKAPAAAAYELTPSILIFAY